MSLVRKPICLVFKLLAQDYVPFCSTVLPVCSVSTLMSNVSLYQHVVTSAPYISPVRITTSHIPNICYTNASTWSFSSLLRPTSTLKNFSSSHQKYAPTSATKSSYSLDQDNVSSTTVTTLPISSH